MMTSELFEHYNQCTHRPPQKPGTTIDPPKEKDGYLCCPFCPNDYKLFPVQCPRCHSSYEAFIKDNFRIQCASCEYPVVVEMPPFDQSEWMSVQMRAQGLRQTLQCPTCHDDDMRNLQLIHCELEGQEEFIIATCKRCSSERCLLPEAFDLEVVRLRSLSNNDGSSGETDALSKTDAERARANDFLRDLQSESSEGSENSMPHDVPSSSSRDLNEAQATTATNLEEEKSSCDAGIGRRKAGMEELREAWVKELQYMEASGSFPVRNFSSFVSMPPSTVTGTSFDDDFDGRTSRFETACEYFDAPNANAVSEPEENLLDESAYVSTDQFAQLKQVAKKMFKPVTSVLLDACAMTVPGGVAAPILAKIAGRVAVELVDPLLHQALETPQPVSSQ